MPRRALAGHLEEPEIERLRSFCLSATRDRTEGEGAEGKNILLRTWFIFCFKVSKTIRLLMRVRFGILAIAAK